MRSGAVNERPSAGQRRTALPRWRGWCCSRSRRRCRDGRRGLLERAADGGPAAGKIVAVGAENQYADVIGQVGGQYVQASALLSNPNTDPHTFEASRAVAREVSAAPARRAERPWLRLLHEQHRGAAPEPRPPGHHVQQLLGLPDCTANPHLWYSPATMPKVADAIAADLAAIHPAHAAYFKANAKASRQPRPLVRSLAGLKAYARRPRGDDRAGGRLPPAGAPARST